MLTREGLPPQCFTFIDSLDDEDVETVEGKTDTQEREPLEEEKLKPVDEDKSVISDKTLILQEG